MTVRAQFVMSPGPSARVTEAMALSDSAFRKRYRSSYETPSSSLSLAFPVWKRYQGTSELILDTDSEDDKIGEEDIDEDEGHGLDDEGHSLDDEGRSLDDEGRSVESDELGLEEEKEVVPKGQQWAAPVMETDIGEPLGLVYGALRRRELAVEEDQVYSTFEVGQGSGYVPEPERPERVSALRQPTLTTWIVLEDGIAYIDVPVYPPPAPPVQTLPSPEWSSGSLPISSAPSVVPSPMISSTVPSPIASPVATPTATIMVNEDQFIEIGVQLELYRGILQDYTQRLDAMPPTLFADIDRDVKELYIRSGVAGHVDTRMEDMSRAGYDDHRLIHDMLVQQAALQRELQEMRGCDTALEQERDRRER
ncbi:hypothetical protein Tco_1399686 [Tanacetum coccineum]